MSRFRIEGHSEAEVEEKLYAQIKQAVDIGFAAVGPIKALDAALITQHKLVSNFFAIVQQAHEYAAANGTQPILPLADEVIDVFNNAAGSMLMIAEIMSRGVLDGVGDVAHPSLESTPPPSGRTLN